MSGNRMSSQGCPTLQQVNQVWSMLDDMYQNDPKSYQTFFERQRKGAHDFYSPPEPDSCLRTEILEPNRGLLYINICGWKHVAAASLTDRSQPVPVFGGRLETHADGGEEHSVLDVAFSPVVLQAARQDRREKEQVHLLALSFTQQQYGLRVSQQYSVCSSRQKGSLEDMRRRLASRQQQQSKPTATTTHPDPALQTPASLLQQISSLCVADSEEGSPVQLTWPEPGDQNKNKNKLIQVISSSVSAQPEEPQHQLTVNSDPGGVSRSMELTVELPKVRSMSECQLSISQDDVLLEVEDRYHLHLKLPETVDEDSACATFNRKTRRLILKVSVL